MRATPILTPLFLLPALAVGCNGTPNQAELAQNTAALSLPSSQFEIDDDANLVSDGVEDWATVDDTRVEDTPSGQDDSSYKGGSKENDLCPQASTGSIPNNKSDLKTFGVWQEAGDPGFLHLFWTRVQDPSGTTLMDFEFNQSDVDCGNGVNPVRTEGDLLLEYRLEQGGATATLKARFWDGSEWGGETDLTAINAATGTINTSAIAEPDSDGLGAMDERTFGEASIDLDFIFEEDKCTSFGSAFVKSRSSDAFNSALKDFIAPIPINLTNCGKVVIRKQTVPANYGGAYGFSHTLATDPPSGNAFSLGDGDSEQFENVLKGNAYTVSEDALGPDVALTDIDCSQSTGVDVTIDLVARNITFDIDSDTDIVDCTFLNVAQHGAIKIVKTRDHAADGAGPHPHEGITFEIEGGDLPGPVQVVTNSSGEACLDGLLLSAIAGDYTVTELVPNGYAAAGDASQVVQVTGIAQCPNGDEVSFHNTPLTNVVCSVDSQIDGGTQSTIVCDGLGPVDTNASGDGSATLNDLPPGSYNCQIIIGP